MDVSTIALSGDGSRVFCATRGSDADPVVAVLDVDTLTVLKTIPFQQKISSIAVNHTGLEIACVFYGVVCV